MEKLRMYAKEEKLYFLGIAETWLHDTVENSEICIEGYSYRRDRAEIKSGRGGGVALYVRDTLSSFACLELNKYHTESVWCKLMLQHKDEIVFGECYKRPNTDKLEINELFAAIKAATQKPVVIMGDFNYPSGNWETLETDTLGKEFLDFVNDCYLIQHINTPTRDSSVLDLVFSSEDGMVENLHVNPLTAK